MSTATEAGGLVLCTEDLFSRYGFNDGDVPEALLDYCDEHGLPYPESGEDGWHRTLAQLVRRFLLPALSRHVDVYEIGTIHNPIRAVEGTAEHGLTPDRVVVPWADVARAAGLEVLQGQVLPDEAWTAASTARGDLPRHELIAAGDDLAISVVRTPDGDMHFGVDVARGEG